MRLKHNVRFGEERQKMRCIEKKLDINIKPVKTSTDRAIP